MESHTHFVVTAWRNRLELLQLRQDLYSPETSKRESAANKVFAWRLRKPDGLPLLLESTADIVDVLLQDERAELKHNALRLLYATAISRFVTGLADTQIELTRDRPAWFPPGKSLQLPLGLLETRHRIVHRHMPSLAELKRAAKDSLEWLWEWYWSQLDHAFSLAKADADEAEPQELVKEKLNTILKTYVKERKNEIKTRKKDANAASNALSTYNLRFAPSSTSTPSTQTQRLLLHLLVEDKMMLPTDKKLGSSMSGAFLIWSPFLLTFCASANLPLPTLLDHLMSAMNAPSAARNTVHPDLDPVREGLSAWTVQILTSPDWASRRSGSGLEDTLTHLFSAPTYWNVRTAEKLLESGHVPHAQQWRAILHAAANEGGDEMDVDGKVVVSGEDLAVKNVGIEGVGAAPREKIKGPRKALGMWRPRPIGWVPEGWEEDE
ncbi:Las1-domain-containing protein [Cucurbitaria berberidis CBS 394.84]|uniref:Las1-domain-containing protein n=1 Tax=Cucurbitaria berberidis CBS 394.84 TaxID=1168544 RepID=A0A9P4GK97_9PLEO|nr:Las1-domain-containing protein [Cucurbitaria berberidis CBS 394.84]KAF1846916.1 Las1-domain-containing protein [Cucurbitaria berberidis CBS 394.84]